MRISIKKRVESRDGESPCASRVAREKGVRNSLIKRSLFQSEWLKRSSARSSSLSEQNLSTSALKLRSITSILCQLFHLVRLSIGICLSASAKNSSRRAGELRIKTTILYTLLSRLRSLNLTRIVSYLESFLFISYLLYDFKAS